MKLLLTTVTACIFFMTAYSQTVLTIGEVFDFETGDEFHLKNEIPQIIAQGQRITITDKWFSASADTVFYVQENDRYLVTPQGMFMPWNYSFSLTTDTVFYTDLDSLITSYEDWMTGDSLMVANNWYHNWFMNDSLLCDLTVNGFRFGPVPLDFPGYNREYGRGVGITWDRYIDEMDNVTANWHLKYYKKGAVICGTPDLTTAELIEQQGSSAMVFPNPFTDHLTFRFADNEVHTIFITDLSGRQLLTMEVADGQTIAVDRLSEGTFLVLNPEGEMIARICK